jgi:pimeloyl-ACP methyl ester carboxylesterase
MSADERSDKDDSSPKLQDFIPARWSEGTIIANDLRQHYYRTGAGKQRPTILLLHGFSENGACWSRVARALEDEYDLILLDARGHGGSDLPATGYSQEALTQDVIAFIAALDLEQPFLWGYSNGAKTAAEMVAAEPERIRAVILEDPPWRAEPPQPAPAASATNVTGGEPWPGYAQWRASWIAWRVELRDQTFAERVASSASFLPPGAADWTQEELFTHLKAQAQFNLALLDVLPPIPLPSPWRATVERITRPILLLTSDPGRGGSITPEVVGQIVATWRGGEHTAFPGASHFLHHEMRGEAFENFIATVRDFLTRR